MSPNLWIVLVNFNGMEDTRLCLQSLSNLAEPANIVVVDNASKVDPTTALLHEFPGIHAFRSSMNGGWAGGNNLGLRYALDHGADWVVLLNNDTIVSPDFVSRLSAAAQNRSGFGVIGPVIRYMDPPHDVQTDGVRFNRAEQPGFFQREIIPLTTTNPPTIADVDIVNGCCLMVSREVVNRIGFIDDDFFLIHEESDFCLRAQRAGFRCGVLAEAVVRHKGSVSFRREGQGLQRYYDARNLVRLIRKHGRTRGRRDMIRSYLHHLRYVFHRYCQERDAGFDHVGEAIVCGVYDGYIGRYGPRNDTPRQGVALLQRVFAFMHALSKRRSMQKSTPIGQK